MFYRVLTCIVERSIYLFTLSNGKKKKKRKEKKNKKKRKEKSHTIPLEGPVFHALDYFGFEA